MGATLPPIMDLTASAASISSLALCAETVANSEEAASVITVALGRLQEQPSARVDALATQVLPLSAADAAVASPAPGPEFEHGHQFDGQAACASSSGIQSTAPLVLEAGPSQQPD